MLVIYIALIHNKSWIPNKSFIMKSLSESVVEFSESCTILGSLKDKSTAFVLVELATYWPSSGSTRTPSATWSGSATGVHEYNFLKELIS